MTLRGKRIGAGILCLVIVISGANWLLDWNILGNFGGFVFALVNLFTVIYLYVIPPVLDEMVSKQTKDK